MNKLICRSYIKNMHQVKEKGWMRHLMNPTWAEDDVKSWHNKSTQRVEKTAMPHELSPHKPEFTRKKVKSPVPSPHSLPPSVHNGAFLHFGAQSSRMAFSLVPDKPEPPVRGAELNLVHCSQGWGGWGGVEVVREAESWGGGPFRTPGKWVELKMLK